MEAETNKLRGSEFLGSIVLLDVRDRGELEKERIVFQVSYNDDIGRYAIFETTASDDEQFSDDIKRIFWFPERPVKTGDLVVLYTKSGNDRIKKNKNGTTSFFFYWALE